MFAKLRIFKRLSELEKQQRKADRAFGILVSEFNKFKYDNRTEDANIPKDKVCKTPKEFMEWFISTP
ncbi:MAG: hypothetical protein GX366_05110 [Epulopiscium sp.]|nr:hypothetical protein [Candidatus Epulonipiscium sp.]